MAQSQAQSQSSDDQGEVSRFWRPAALGGIVLSIVGLYDPIKDVYLKVYDPDYQGIVSVPFAEYQLKLADRNAACFLDMKRTRVDVSDTVAISYGSCPNNNVHIGVYPKNRPAYQRWLEPNREGDLAHVAGGFFPAAFAATFTATEPAGAASALTPAQTTLKTICQERPAQDQRRIVRITDEGGQCYFERVNILSGVIEIREPVPCDAQCGATAKSFSGK